MEEDNEKTDEKSDTFGQLMKAVTISFNELRSVESLERFLEKCGEHKVKAINRAASILYSKIFRINSKTLAVVNAAKSFILSAETQSGVIYNVIHSDRKKTEEDLSGSYLEDVPKEVEKKNIVEFKAVGVQLGVTGKDLVFDVKMLKDLKERLAIAEEKILQVEFDLQKGETIISSCVEVGVDIIVKEKGNREDVELEVRKIKEKLHKRLQKRRNPFYIFNKSGGFLFTQDEVKINFKALSTNARLRKGVSIFHALEELKFYSSPFYTLFPLCSHKYLPPGGFCGTCSVKITTLKSGKKESRIVSSCTKKVPLDGSLLEITVSGDKELFDVQKRHLMEFHNNHLDCTQGCPGRFSCECKGSYKKFSESYTTTQLRDIEDLGEIKVSNKREYRNEISSFFFNPSKCVNCFRCIRVCNYMNNLFEYKVLTNEANITELEKKVKRFKKQQGELIVEMDILEKKVKEQYFQHHRLELSIEDEFTSLPASGNSQIPRKENFVSQEVTKPVSVTKKEHLVKKDDEEEGNDEDEDDEEGEEGEEEDEESEESEESEGEALPTFSPKPKASQTISNSEKESEASKNSLAAILEPFLGSYQTQESLESKKTKKQRELQDRMNHICDLLREKREKKSVLKELNVKIDSSYEVIQGMKERLRIHKTIGRFLSEESELKFQDRKFNKTLFLSGLPNDTTFKQLNSIFSQFGSIEGRICFRKERNFAIINYVTLKSAILAFEDSRKRYNSKIHLGMKSEIPIGVQYDIPKGDTVVVVGFEESEKEELLKSFSFEKYFVKNHHFFPGKKEKVVGEKKSVFTPNYLLIKFESGRIHYAQKFIIDFHRVVFDNERIEVRYERKIRDVLNSRDLQMNPEQNTNHVGRFVFKEFNELKSLWFQSGCISCGLCVNICPSGALTFNQELKSDVRTEFYGIKRLILKEKIFGSETTSKSRKIRICMIAPAVQATVSDYSQFDSVGDLIAFFKQVLGFDYVFDISFAADLCVELEGDELIERLLSRKKFVYPLFSSCCPPHVNHFYKYCEPEEISNISDCKSPMGILVELVTAYFRERKGKKKEDLVMCSVMPCFGKKMERTGIDYVFTLQEIASFVQEKSIRTYRLGTKYKRLSTFSKPFCNAKSTGIGFGVAGGVSWAALRYACEKVGDKKGLAQLRNLKIKPLHFTSLDEKERYSDPSIGIGNFVLTLPSGDTKNVRFAFVTTIRSSKILLRLIRDGKIELDFVEVMSCPKGCLSGAGNKHISPKDHSLLDMRKQKLFDICTEKRHKELSSLKRIVETKEIIMNTFYPNDDRSKKLIKYRLLEKKMFVKHLEVYEVERRKLSEIYDFIVDEHKVCDLSLNDYPNVVMETNKNKSITGTISVLSRWKKNIKRLESSSNFFQGDGEEEGEGLHPFESNLKVINY